MKTLLIALLLPVFLGAAPAPERPLLPFGHHLNYYARGCLKPSGSQADLDQACRDFYAQWSRHYLLQGCGPERWYVWYTADGPNPGQNPQAVCVSEGQAYGMLIAVYFAGVEPKAREIFDGLWRFKQDQPSPNNAALMGWQQIRSGDACAPAGSASSATDADLDMAYALLLADRQWGSVGPVNYKKEAGLMLEAILESEAYPEQGYLLLGDWVGKSGGPHRMGTRVSDFMPSHFRAFKAASAEAGWSQLLNGGYRMMLNLQKGASPKAGLFPDFAVSPANDPQPPSGRFLETDKDGDYNWNACRVPLRLALDFMLHGDARAYGMLQRMNAFFKASTGGQPAAIKAGYRLDGSPREAYSSLAFRAPLAAAAVCSEDLVWLDACWRDVVDAPLSADTYYGNTLKLLSLVAISGNWWSPASVAKAE